jgi:hypothetical protein
MKRLLIILIILIPSTTLCQNTSKKEEGSGIKMKFYNSTGYDLDALLIGNKLIGHLSKDSTTDYINFDSFVFDSGHADANLEALISRRIVQTPKYRRCGTQMKTVTTGTYECDIVYSMQNGIEIIRLQNH